MAWVLEGGFGATNLRTTSRPAPAPGPGEVRLRVLAASINYRDLLMIDGTYNPKVPLPLVPLSDGVGEVTDVGEGVSRVRVGDRVCPIFSLGWHDGAPNRAAIADRTLGGPLDGCLRKHMTLSAEDVVIVPDHLSAAAASTLPCAGLTAWSALMEHRGGEPARTVLTQGTGGVSIFALQIAKALGARVIATTGSPEKEDRLRALGADHVINYRADPQWGKSARKWIADRDGSEGVDHIVDVGGASSLEQSFRAARPGATISVIGILGGPKAPLNVLPILMNQLRVQGIFVGHRRGMEALCQFMVEHKLDPVVSSVGPFENAVEAMAQARAGTHFGKVCVDVEEAGHG
ncbi:MAG: NAD(P)-dependent alcohol dehydrogenase [Myxococcales bacterium]|nr:NAD(P)-dependent alcohol dehydrogenase [Myxococcales bacterium]